MSSPTQEQWLAARARHERFVITELGKLYLAHKKAMIAYWQKDGDVRVSDRRLGELDAKAREAEQAFVTTLMEIAGVEP